MQIEKILKKIQIQELNPMQKQVYTASENQQDIVLLSPTGSGKTIAFLLPLLRSLDLEKNGVQALIMVPSRELALQIEQVFKTMGTNFKVNACYGGHSTKIEQNNFIEPPAVLVSTPGRLLYHLRNRNFDPNTIKTLVLDEFDKALEMGFQDDMESIISAMLSLQQRILTSATAMKQIPDFTGLDNPQTISFLKDADTKVDLQFKRINTSPDEKLETLFKLICKIGNKRTLIFCNHREAVDRIGDLLRKKGISRENFHGGMEQDERERALLKFRNGSSQILITTDLAARGLDIPEVEYIIHYQLPVKEDSFIHRNGRTARMNAKGVVYLIIAQDEDFPFIKDDIAVENLNDNYKIPQPNFFQTLYLSMGKKDKINKVDIVGFFMKKGKLEKEDIGLIEVRDTSAYVAINRKKVPEILKILSNEKIKNKKVKMEVSK